MAEGNPRVGSEVTHITHNFCDSTTWYCRSVRVTDEALTDSGGGLVWNSANANWIDMIHGKVFDEEGIAAGIVHGYAVEVKVDSVVQTMRAPWAQSGGDYEVDFATGDVTFYVSQAGKTVEASYSHAGSGANGSEYFLKPTAGKILDIESAEVQFSKDCVINDTIDFEIWVYDPAAPPNKIKYSNTAYKTMRNFIDEAQGSYPVVPAIGGVNRGTQQETYGFPFRYGTVRRLQDSQGTELRIRLRGGTAFGGEHATATFYCTSRDE